jgi:hypothetical protein
MRIELRQCRCGPNPIVRCKLSYGGAIGRLSLLKSQFDEVLIPDVVRLELERMPDSNGRLAVSEAFGAGWLRCRSITQHHIFFCPLQSAGQDCGRRLEPQSGRLNKDVESTALPSNLFGISCI